MEKSAQIFCILEGILMAIVGILFFINQWTHYYISQ